MENLIDIPTFAAVLMLNNWDNMLANVIHTAKNIITETHSGLLPTLCEVWNKSTFFPLKLSCGKPFLCVLRNLCTSKGHLVILNIKKNTNYTRSRLLHTPSLNIIPTELHKSIKPPHRESFMVFVMFSGSERFKLSFVTRFQCIWHRLGF